MSDIGWLTSVVPRAGRHQIRASGHSYALCISLVPVGQLIQDVASIGQRQGEPSTLDTTCHRLGKAARSSRSPGRFRFAGHAQSTHRRSSPTPSARSPLHRAVRSCCSVDARAYPARSSFIHLRRGWPAAPVKFSPATARKRVPQWTRCRYVRAVPASKDVAAYGSGQLARSLFDLGLVERAPVDDLPGGDRRGQAPLRRHRHACLRAG
jgi:hypothetical protein